jgi:hypothetical protein
MSRGDAATTPGAAWALAEARTLLFVPGDRPERFGKAEARAAVAPPCCSTAAWSTSR